MFLRFMVVCRLFLRVVVVVIWLRMVVVWRLRLDVVVVVVLMTMVSIVFSFVYNDC